MTTAGNTAYVLFRTDEYEDGSEHEESIVGLFKTLEGATNAVIREQPWHTKFTKADTTWECACFVCKDGLTWDENDELLTRFYVEERELRP